MSKLLRANFMRLRQSLSFWVCIVLQVFAAAMVFLMAYFMYQDKEKSLIFDRSFMVGSYIMFFLSVFITSFICTDYSYQTIRNKLIVGYSREEIYLSNLITVWISSLVIVAAYLITIAALSVFLGLGTGMLPNELCFLILTQIAAVTALVSLYVLLSETVTRKSVAVTAALILSLIFSTIGDTSINPKSIFFTDIMPIGQLIQMEQMEKIADIQRIFPIYSLAVTVVSTAIGIMIFRRKGLK